MDKKTALSAAGALAMTSAAAVSALFLTIGQGATASPEPTTPVVPDVVTEYQVVQVEPDPDVVSTASTAVATSVPRTIYEIEYVQEAPVAAAIYADDHEESEYDDEYEDEDDEHEDDDEYEEDEYEDDDD